MEKTVGDLQSEMVEEMRLEWRITDFFSFSDAGDTSFYSPTFHFSGESWLLEMNPNKESKDGTKGWVGVYLWIGHFSVPVTVSSSFGLNKTDGGKYKELHFTHAYEKCDGYGFSTFVKRSELVEKKATLVPRDVLTITCSMKILAKPGFVCRIQELSRDFSLLLKDETDNDVTARVETEEFRLHRNILGVRSPVLAAMFRHETKEKVTGVVAIEDCRAEVFRAFTHYLYTGKVEKLSADNVLGLFKVADKYQVEELADDCVRYMENTLTADTFCDAIEVALDHGKQTLMNKSIDLLSDKMEEIIKSEQWKSFLLKNPLLANEQLQKAFERNKK